jgi:DNA ligase (NAD+)
VIPAVERVLEKNEAGETTWKLPASCPTCGTGLNKVGAHHFCPNPQCPDQVRGRIAFFVARGQMDIEGLGPETIDVLVSNDLVHDVDDLYYFDTEKLLELPGFGEKKVAQIRDGIRKSKDQPFHIVFPSLGIPDIGQKVTELLLENGFTSITSVIEAADAGDTERLLAIHGIGERTAETLIHWLRLPEIRRRIERLEAAGLRFQEEASTEAGGVFAGQVWCVTGSFAAFTPREKAMDEVTRRGGKYNSTVTSKTTHLLAGEAPGGKLAKARAVGAVIVTEAEFIEILKKA